ncbi:MAG: PKD domain-containing protein [Saprospiraceae bacterium]|nr:PKD domain-containing protein [Saprospiraceae bacterium]
MTKLNCKTISILISLFFSLCAHGQTAQDSIKGIINHYAKVSALDLCDAKLTVSDTTGFRKGTRIIMCQMNGAAIKSSNNSDFGIIEDLRNTGKYEVNFIDSVAANTVYLKLYPKNEYDAGSAIQIVTYPYYPKAVVKDTLRAKAWDGQSGGFLAFEADILTLNAPILATATGFRGGAVKAYTFCDALEFYNNYFYDLNTTSKQNGAPKGEGVASIIAGKECGRGAQSNGGGGGNNHKAGGGGGAHFTEGGIGGKQNHVNLIRNCIGDWPGLGGLPISATGNDRIFFGGGGGAGHNRENSDNHGGSGGGIVIVKANILTGNGKTIASNGEDGPSNTSDGGPGGGAGGTVILLATQVVGTVNVEAKGGAGGNTISIQEYDFGPGGGGAGGRSILSNSTGITTIITGGIPGKNAISRQNQGAAKGNDGLAQTFSNFKLPSSVDTVFRTLEIVQQPVAIQICEYQTTTFSIKAHGTNLRYEWQINKGNGFVPLASDTTFIGVGTATLIVNRPRTTLNPFLFRCVVISGCQQSNSINSQAVGVNILPAPISLFTPIISYNTVQFNNTSSNGTSFHWTFGDGRTSTSRDTTITYAIQGEYDVTLRTINNCDTAIYTVRIKLNSAPKASFESTSTSYCSPATVEFKNTSSNNSVSYRWSFPGGSPITSTDINPSVLYTTAGTYDVTLIVINGNGRDTITKVGYIKVNTVPSANFRKLQNGNNPVVSFENLTIGATSYVWDFGDGTTSTEASPQHTYTSGTFVVTLRATNACGTSIKKDSVILLSLPSAIISANQLQGCTPFTVQFTGQNASNVGTWAWSFPGGTPSTSTLPNPRVIYNTEGAYSVSLKVSNAAGIYETTRPDYIKVRLAPKADFDFIITDTMVKFTNKSTNANSFIWDFGDFTFSSLQTPANKIYARNGNYNVTLQALNAFCGAAITRQVTIFVVDTKDLSDTEKGITTYPNPTDGKLYLSFKEKLDADYQLVVLSSQGQVIKNVALTRDALQTLDLQNLVTGVYILQFSNDKQRFVKRIIKM